MSSFIFDKFNKEIKRSKRKPPLAVGQNHPRIVNIKRQGGKKKALRSGFYQNFREKIKKKKKKSSAITAVSLPQISRLK